MQSNANDSCKPCHLLLWWRAPWKQNTLLLRGSAMRCVFKSQHRGAARNQSSFMNTSGRAALLVCLCNLLWHLLWSMCATFYPDVYDKYIITESFNGILAIWVWAVIHLLSFSHLFFPIQDIYFMLKLMIPTCEWSLIINMQLYSQ